ncbi:EthD family reductase [Sulfurimonas sp.]|uniref:EthD family reductase n=2 Tax=Sulfurimonas sp. TaxID=2022749 RepID=UPI003D0DF55C
MLNYTLLHREKEDSRFDFEYYLNVHMPRSIELLSNAKGFVKVSVEKGVELQEYNIASNYVAMCHYYFETIEDFLNAFMPHAEELQGDIKNYTDIEPTIQINEVKITA